MVYASFIHICYNSKFLNKSFFLDSLTLEDGTDR
jgi:hypothetical protein